MRALGGSVELHESTVRVTEHVWVGARVSERPAPDELWERAFLLLGDTRLLTHGPHGELAMKLTTYADVLAELHELRNRGDVQPAPGRLADSNPTPCHVEAFPTASGTQSEPTPASGSPPQTESNKPNLKEQI